MTGNTYKNLFSGVAWTAAMRWAVRAIGFLNILILARLLTPEAFGIVVMATERWPEHEDWGTVLIVEHVGGLQTFYAHLDSIAVKEGEEVRQGQVIAVPGSTGKSTGPHLHFEIHRNGEPIDPSILIPEWR